MSAMLCTTTDLELDVWQADEAIADAYATDPVMVALPPAPKLDEETLHSSFEKAISERLIASHGYWGRLNTSSLSQPLPTTDPVKRVTSMKRGVALHPLRLPQQWQRHLVYVCLALIFVMLGFDLMGVLVLSMLH
jgi:hypothetical protein